MRNRKKASLPKKNRTWATAAASANGYANSMMPMMNALGYVQYVVCDIGRLYGNFRRYATSVYAGTGALTLGAIASF